MTYTIQEAAIKLGFSDKTIKRRIKDGDLPAVKIGKSIRIHETALTEFEKGKPVIVNEPRA